MELLSEISETDYIKNNQLDAIIGEMLFLLLKVKPTNPHIFMVKFLASKVGLDALENFDVSITGQLQNFVPLLKFPDFMIGNQSIIRNVLKQDLWEKLRYRVTSLNNDFYSCIKDGIDRSDVDVGVIACDAEAYTVFYPIFKLVLSEIHGDLPCQTDLKPAQLPNIVHSGLLEVKIKFFRNFEKYSYPRFISCADSMEIGRITREYFSTIDGTVEGVDTVDSRYPNRQGTFVGDEIKIKVNHIEHIKISASSTTGDFAKPYNTAIHHLDAISKIEKFAQNERYGYLNANLMDTGLGLTITAIIRTDIESVQEIVEENQLTVQEVRENVYQIQSIKQFGQSELEALENVYNTVNLILSP